MTRKRKANIRPDLIGELFLKPGEDVPYRLIRCDTEPTAIMRLAHMLGSIDDIPQPISSLSDFVQLKPIKPIEKPKKPRADLGKHHKKAARTPPPKIEPNAVVEA